MLNDSSKTGAHAPGSSAVPQRMTVAIVGAGVTGRLLALKLSGLATKQVAITIFDCSEQPWQTSASAAAAGMLAPLAEIDGGDPSVVSLGLASLEIWPDILNTLPRSVYFQRSGSLIVAHSQDLADLTRFSQVLSSGGSSSDQVRELAGAELREIEPALDHGRFARGLYLPTEGQIDARGFLQASELAFNVLQIERRYGAEVESISPGTVYLSGESKRNFDVVIDTRGQGAMSDLKDLRVVRGELVWLHSSDVQFRRPTRLLHPRYPLYVVPRPGNLLLVGATSIESEDHSPISLRSTLELLSAAYIVNSGLAEARIVETVVGLRPAFPDHRPRVIAQPGLIQINGLYRHGFLAGPKLAELVTNWILTGKRPQEPLADLFHFAPAMISSLGAEL